MQNQNRSAEKRTQENLFLAQINNKTISADSPKELVRNCLQEIYNKFKDLPADERKQAYVDYFVKTFSYDDNLRTNTLAEDRKPSFELSEQELANLFITKKGVCNQFAQALALLSNFDDEFIIRYCVCEVYIESEQKTVGHAINCYEHNSKQEIIDISSAIHCKEGKYTENRESDFEFVNFDDYILNLEKDAVKYAYKCNDRSKYILQAYQRFKTFDNNYLLLNLPLEEINKEEKFYYFLSTNVADIESQSRNKEVASID